MPRMCGRALMTLLVVASLGTSASAQAGSNPPPPGPPKELRERFSICAETIVAAAVRRARTGAAGHDVVRDAYRWIDSIPIPSEARSSESPAVRAALEWLVPIREAGVAKLVDAGVEPREAWRSEGLTQYAGRRSIEGDDLLVDEAMVACGDSIIRVWSHLASAADSMPAGAEQLEVRRRLYCWVDMTPSMWLGNDATFFQVARGEALSALEEHDVKAWEAWACSDRLHKDQVLQALGYSLTRIARDADALGRSEEGATPFARCLIEISAGVTALAEAVSRVEYWGRDSAPEGQTLSTGEVAEAVLEQLRRRAAGSAANLVDAREKQIAHGLIARAELVATRRLRLQGVGDSEPVKRVEGAAGGTAARVRATVDRLAKQGFSGAVLVGRDGKVVAECAVGFADLEGTKPNTPETLFEIASLTKQFTAAAVMRLVQDGKLSLDDPIAKHLPGVPESCAAITVEHLLRHTSGIPGTNSAGGGDDLSKVLPIFLGEGPTHAPGTHWEYWNQGYALLSEIVARVSGKSCVDYCRSALFEPAGMTTARFTGDSPPEGALVSIGRSHSGPARSALDHPYGSYGFQYRGMGGAVCSVRDLWKWDRALAGDAILNDASKTSLFTPGLHDYALGWFVKRDEKGRLVQTHGGAVRGFRCDMRRLPDLDGAVIVLANDDGAPVRDVMQSLERALRGEPPAPEESLSPLPADLVRALAGTFKSDRGSTLTIADEGMWTAASIEWPGGALTRAKLHADGQSKPVLFDGTDVIPISLERGADGSVSAVTLVNQAFKRVAKQP